MEFMSVTVTWGVTCLVDVTKGAFREKLAAMLHKNGRVGSTQDTIRKDS
jgi:hypothetical protein